MLYFMKLFELIKLRNESQYSITRKRERFQNQILSPATLQKCRDSCKTENGEPIRISLNTATLIRLCMMLNCLPEDIMEQDIEHDDGLRKTIQFIRSEENHNRYTD